MVRATKTLQSLHQRVVRSHSLRQRNDPVQEQTIVDVQIDP